MKRVRHFIQNAMRFVRFENGPAAKFDGQRGAALRGCAHRFANEIPRDPDSPDIKGSTELEQDLDPEEARLPRHAWLALQGSMRTSGRSKNEQRGRGKSGRYSRPQVYDSP